MNTYYFVSQTPVFFSEWDTLTTLSQNNSTNPSKKYPNGQNDNCQIILIFVFPVFPLSPRNVLHTATKIPERVIDSPIV